MEKARKKGGNTEKRSRTANEWIELYNTAIAKQFCQEFAARLFMAFGVVDFLR